MSTVPRNALLIEADDKDAAGIEQAFEDSSLADFRLSRACRLDEALKKLETEEFEVVLLDLSLPDSSGMETLVTLQIHSPPSPVVVLSNVDDERVALATLHQGAQDYLIKDDITAPVLAKALHFAIERHRLHEEVRNLALMDELTGLYNRRGFLALAQQQVRVADRTGRPMLLFFIDVDGMKKINDTLGHAQGDLALKTVADLLQDSFRASDIVARIGGDEFVALAIETSEVGADVLSARLHKKLQSTRPPGINMNQMSISMQLSISMGIAHYSPSAPCTIDELLIRGDQLMYEQKREKKDTRSGGG